MGTLPLNFNYANVQTSSVPSAHMQAVVTTAGSLPKQSLKERAAQVFAAANFANAAEWFVEEVVWRNLKWALRNSAVRFIDMIFNGPGHDGYPPGYTAMNYWSYNNYAVYPGSTWQGGNAYGSTAPWGSLRGNDGSYQPRSQSNRASYQFGSAGSSLTYQSAADAEAVLDACREILKNQGRLTLGQVLDLSGLGYLADPTTHTRGWRDLSSFSIVNNGPDGAILIYGPQITV